MYCRPLFHFVHLNACTPILVFEASYYDNQLVWDSRPLSRPRSFASDLTTNHLVFQSVADIKNLPDDKFQADRSLNQLLCLLDCVSENLF